MTETLAFTPITEQLLLTPEEENDRREIIAAAIAGRTLDLCTHKPIYNFGDPGTALRRAGSRANID